MIASSLRPQDEIFQEHVVWGHQSGLENYAAGWNALEPWYILNRDYRARDRRQHPHLLDGAYFARLNFRFRGVLFGFMLLDAHGADSCGL